MTYELNPGSESLNMKIWIWVLDSKKSPDHTPKPILKNGMLFIQKGPNFLKSVKNNIHLKSVYIKMNLTILKNRNILARYSKGILNPIYHTGSTKVC